MKRNRFRLETVMRVRRIQEDIELSRLAQARLDVARALAAEVASIQAYQVATQPDQSGSSTREFLNDRVRLDRLGEQISTARRETADRRDEEDRRHADWSIAAQRVSALDRLRTNHTEAHHAALVTEDVSDSDERTMQRGLAQRLAASDAVTTHRITPRITPRVANRPDLSRGKNR